MLSGPKEHQVRKSQMLATSNKESEFAVENEINECHLIPKQLIDEYAQEMPSRLNRLRHLIPQAAVGSAEALQVIIDEAHKLRGTAGSFGLPAIGVAMAEIEDLLVNLGNAHLGFRDSGAWLMIDKALWMAKDAVGDKHAPHLV
jgi:HPt (histidine-containing phosphotransfer) domain-containing protein